MKPAPVFARLCVWSALAFLAACSDGPSEAESIARAREAAAKREFSRAHLELQNALQKNAYSSEARFLLAQILLDVDQPALAVVELRKALDQGHAEALVLPLLAKALLRQNMTKAVVDEFGRKSLNVPEADAELKTAVATALFNTGRGSEAQAMVDGVLATLPTFAPAAVFKAQMMADRGQVDAALALLEELLQRDANQGDAWRVKGDLQLYAKGDSAGAAASYAKALEVRPTDTVASKALIVMLLAQGNLPEAERRLADMKRASPNALQARYFDAQIVYQKGDPAKARELLAPLLKASPENPWVLVLAGAVELELNALSQAEAILLRALRVYPGLQNARLLLARTHLRQGDPQRAIATLEPMLGSRANASAQAFTTAAEAYLLIGNPRRASDMYAAAERQAPQSDAIALGKARALLAQGQTEAAMTEFVRLSSADDSAAPDLALINAHMQRGRLADAVQAIDKLIEKRPKAPLGHKLRAELALRQGQPDQARASFERCLALDPDYFAAVAGLAALDMRQGKPEDARKRFDALLARQPKLLPARLGLAQLLKVLDAPAEEVLAQLTTAATDHPDDARAQIELVNHLVQAGEPQQALSVATRADRAIPNDTTVMLALAQAQEAQGDLQQAMSTYGKILAVRPQVLAAHLGLGELQLKRKDMVAAAGSFRKALQVSAQTPAAVRGLVRVEIAAGRHDAAITLARDHARKHAASPLGAMLEAEAELARARPDAAAAAFAQALARPQATGSLAAYAHAVLWQAGRRDKAEALVADWMKTRPADVQVLASSGSVALQAGDKELAEKRFREVLASQPEHVASLNNLAWLLATDRRAGALELAERAVRLRPNSPQVLDTLARALEADGQLAKAADAQRQAIARDKQKVPDYNLSLVRLLLAQGKKTDAQSELAKLAALGDAHPAAPEIARLRQAAAQ